MFAIILSLCLFTVHTLATLTVNLPLQDQLAPTARVGQQYSWTFSNRSFTVDSGAALSYTASGLPSWLSFDSETRTFSGTPSPKDEGLPRINVTAHQGSPSAAVSSNFSICVSSYAAPTLNVPLETQFQQSNPSLSSVFVLDTTSALFLGRPALRIPPSWSFSIGFQSNTFSDVIGYAVSQADGSAPPSWLRFDNVSSTLSGVTPYVRSSDPPTVIPLSLHGVDQNGYSSAQSPFDVVVAAHELRSARPLPTINVTTAAPFNLSLWSSLDYSGLFIDGHPIQSANISEVLINTSEFDSWLKYEDKTRRLSGEPPDSLGTLTLSPLPVEVTTSFHQQIHTNVSIALVPSFFSAETFEDLHITPGQAVNFKLTSFLSGRTDLGSPSEVNVTATFEPENSNSFLAFDNKTMLLSGSIPPAFQDDAVKVTFTAFSRVTHSTSHANLNLSLDRGRNASTPTSAEKKARSRVLLGIAIAFGIIGGLLLLTAFVAICRRCTRDKNGVHDSEEGRQGSSDSEEHWYGFGAVEKKEPSQSEGVLVNLSDSIRRFGSSTLGRIRPSASANSFRSPPPPSGLVPSPEGTSMKKAEFVGKIRNAVRVVSDKYTSVSRRMRPSKSRPRLVIGLPQPAQGNTDTPPFTTPIPANPPASLSLGGSPSSSIPDSIPTRRADFAPPKNSSPRQGSLLSSTRGIGPSVNYEHSSPRSASERSSIESHTQEAVVQTARAMSVRSGQSVSVSYPSQTLADGGRPRLVPFTSSSRVPVPRIPSGDNGNLTADYGNAAGLKRIASLSVEVEGKGSREEDLGSYVRAFGMDPPDDAVPSFSSLVSSQTSVTTKSRPARFLARAGERFLFTIYVAEMADMVDVRLVSGGQLPRFVHVNRMAGINKNVVQLWGLPAIGDEGELEIGIYASDRGGCIGKAIMEVVSKT